MFASDKIITFLSIITYAVMTFNEYYFGMKWNESGKLFKNFESNRGDDCLGILGSRVTNTHDQQQLLFISMFFNVFQCFER